MTETTETKTPEIKETPLNVEQQTEVTLKAIEMQYKGLLGGIRLHVRTLLNMLTASNMNGNIKHQVKDSLERAIIAALDYGVDIGGKEAPVRTHGALGKLESNLAMQMAKAKEYSMVLVSQKMENSLKEQKGDQTNGQETNKIETETKSETN